MTASAKFYVSVNGGALQDGGVDAPSAATLDLVPGDIAGWLRVRWEIYDYPEGFATPAGWTLGGNGTIFSTDFTPAQIALPADTVLWGVWMLRCLVNEQIDTDTVVIGALLDESTAVCMPSPLGLRDIGAREGEHFTTATTRVKRWVRSFQRNIRALEAIIVGAGITVPSGTGFRKVVAGVEQGTAELVTLSDPAEVDGVLPAASGGTGADFSAATGLVAVAAGAFGTVAVPSAGLVGTDAAQTLQNKTIDASNDVAAGAVSGTLGTAHGGLGFDNTTLAANDGKALAAKADGSIQFLELSSLSDVGLRLTLTTGTPLPVSDVTGASTLYYTPHQSGHIMLWDGAIWRRMLTDEISLALSSLTSGKNYDVFAYASGASVLLELSAAWTSDTARADALARQNGVLVKSADHTRRYVGTIRTTGTSTTEDSVLKRFVWNRYNQTERALTVTEATTTWTYATASWRQVRAQTGNRVEYVSGESVVLQATACGLVTGSGTGGACSNGIGIDSTTSPSGLYGKTSETAGVGSDQVGAFYKGRIAEGYHAVNWLEYGFATCTFNGTQSPWAKTGLVASIQG